MMGFFSFNCNGCQHPMLSKYATSPFNDWMRQVVVIEKDGTIRQGEYDGYGRVDDVEVSNVMEVCCYHAACWEKAGKPTEYQVSLNAPDQGYFFDDEHNMENPLSDLWRDIGEGPFTSEEEAARFMDAEVGVEARLRAVWIIEVKECK